MASTVLGIEKNSAESDTTTDLALFTSSVQFSHSVVSDSATPWTVAHQDPLSMGFSRQEYWSGLPCLSPGNLPDPGIKAASLMSPALAGSFFTK